MRHRHPARSALTFAFVLTAPALAVPGGKGTEICGSKELGPCLEPHEGGGCDDSDCCVLVCTAFSFCCTDAWNPICADIANLMCDALGCKVGDCPAGAVDESESCVLIDQNQGCFAVFVHPDGSFSFGQQFMPIACGDTICGETRSGDQDHYEFTVAEDDTIVTVSLVADLPMRASIRTATCPPDEPYVTLAEAEGDCPTVISPCLDKGTYRLFLRTTLPGFACTSGPYRYIATLTCAPSKLPCFPPDHPPKCGTPTTGSCFTDTGSPFCDDAQCCQFICSLDPFCCEGEWDGICAEEAIKLCYLPPLLNDECDGALDVSDGVTEFNNFHATTNPRTPPLPEMCDEGFGLAFDHDIWYRYTAPCSGEVLVSTCKSFGLDTRLAVYGGTCDDLQLIACNDDAPAFCDVQSILQFKSICGEQYIIRIGSFGGTFGGGGAFEIACSGSCPPDPDLDDDGEVDGFDLALLLGQWGPCESKKPGECPADLNSDGVVNGFDLAMLLAAWG